MIQAKCIQKFRDKNNNIYGYRLIDLNGQTQDVQAKNLKQSIANGTIHVVNLTLTSDGRLVDTTEKHLQNKSLGKEPVKPVTKKEMTREMYADENYELMLQIKENTGITDFSDDFIEEGTDSNYNFLTDFCNLHYACDMEIDIWYKKYVEFTYTFNKRVGKKTETYGFKVRSLSINMNDIIDAYNKFEKLYTEYSESKTYISVIGNKVGKFKSLGDYNEKTYGKPAEKPTGMAAIFS